MTSPALLRAAHATAAGLLAVTLAACAPEPAPGEQTTGSTGATTQTTGSTGVSGTSGTTDTPATGSGAATDDSRCFDLMHVQQTASPCSMVWVVGNILPEDYQWCSDDQNNPVAGVRVGPCEVVAYARTMYGVPGREIAPVVGTLDRDQAYLDMLTACKRKPYSSSERKDAQ